MELGLEPYTLGLGSLQANDLILPDVVMTQTHLKDVNYQLLGSI